jgi:hypothetical protein
MNKILFILCVISLSAYSASPSVTPSLTTELDEHKEFNPYESHWVSLFNFETMKYETPYNFRGVKKNFGDSKQDLYAIKCTWTLKTKVMLNMTEH